MISFADCSTKIKLVFQHSFKGHSTSNTKHSERALGSLYMFGHSELFWTRLNCRKPLWTFSLLLQFPCACFLKENYRELSKNFSANYHDPPSTLSIIWIRMQLLPNCIGDSNHSTSSFTYGTIVDSGITRTLNSRGYFFTPI